MDAETIVWLFPLIIVTFILVINLILYIRWRNDPDTKWYREIKKGLEKNKHKWWGINTREIKSTYSHGTMKIIWDGGRSLWIHYPNVYIDGSEKPLELSFETRQLINEYVNGVRLKYSRNKEKFDEEIRKTILAQKYYDKCVSKIYW